MKYFSFLLIALALISCKKKTTVTIQAQDYISGSGATYSGQKYVVNEKWNSFGTQVKTVSEGYLDANGYASFDLKMKNSRQYILAVNQPENICYGGVTQHYLEHEKSNVVNFKYAACAKVKIEFQNVNCYDNFDDFSFYYMGREVPGKEGLIGRLIKHGVGCYSFAFPDFGETPVGKYYYKWEITRNNILTTIHDTITLVEGDQYIYIVNY